MMKSIKLALIASLGLTSQLNFAHAQDASSSPNVYVFGPSCSSAGQWTQKASQATQQLIATVNSLAANPACKGMSALIPALQTVQDQALQSETGSDSDTGDTPAQSQNKMAALATIAMSPDQNMTPFAGSARKLFANESLRNAVNAYSSSGASDKSAPLQTFYTAAKGRSTLLSRGARAASSSARFLTMFAQALPGYDSCLVGRQSETAVILSSVVNIGASIAGGGSGMSPSTSGLIKSILDLIQNQKFSGAIARLNQAQLNQSLSCLMEVSTESYCSALDMQRLVKTPDLDRKTIRDPDKKKEIDKTIKANIDESKLDDQYGNTPLSGYYVLTVHLPNIYRWIQSVQFGVNASWETDALFKSQTEALVSAFKQKTYSLPAVLAEASTQLIKLTDKDARKQGLITAIQNITNRIGELANVGPINFFFQTKSQIVLPFYLLDEENNIPACIYKTDAGTTCDPWTQLQDPNSNFNRLKNFDATYLATIQKKLQTLIESSTEKASVYYQSRVIVNSVNLAVDSLIGSNYSVKDSFEFISMYLTYLEKFISTRGQDYPDLIKIVAAIRNTHNRFDRILVAYDRLDQLAKMDRLSSGYNQVVEDAYKNVINEVYNQFDILWQKDGFVVGTLNNFVSAEYILRIKSGIGLEGYDRQFLLVSGKDLLETLKSAHFTNRTDIASDLSSAQEMNLTNIEVIDGMFFNNFYNTILMYNLRISGKEISNSTVNKMFAENIFDEANFNPGTQTDHPVIMKALGILGPLGKALGESVLNTDKHPIHFSANPYIMNTGDTTEGDFKRRRDTFCLQSLAFVRRGRFDLKMNGKPGLCHNVKLMSDYWGEIPDDKKSLFGNLNVSYDEILAATKVKDPVQVKKANDQAICAFRNFRRNNMVYFLTKDVDQRTNPKMSERIQVRQDQTRAKTPAYDPDDAIDSYQKKHPPKKN